MAPILKKEHNLVTVTHSGSWFYKYSGAINSIGHFAHGFAEVLRKLTHREDLNYLNLGRLKNVIADRGLCRPNRAWCPLCFSDMHKHGIEIYEPLIWSIKDFMVCPKHQISLSYTCPYNDCGLENSFLSYDSKPGYCYKCGRWLGLNPEVGSTTECQDLKKYIWTAKNIEQLILRMQGNDFKLTSDHVSLALKSLVEIETNGNIAAFAREVEIPKVTLWSWCKGENLPTLGGMLKICYSLNRSLIGLLFSNEVIPTTQNRLRIEIQIPNDKAKKPHNKFDYEGVKAQIEDILTEIPPYSLSDVSQLIGYSINTLRKYYPEICKEISTRYADYKRKRAEIRLERLSQELRDVILKLHGEGVYPSRRQIEALMKYNAILREKALQNIWKDALIELNLKMK